MQFEWACIVVVAVCWGGYPLIARTSGHGSPLGTLVLFMAGLLPIALAALSRMSDPVPSLSAVVRLSVAGVIMGTGLVAFNLVVNSKLNASVSLPVINAASLIVSALGALYFFDEPVSARKVLSLSLLLAGIVAMPVSS